MTADHENFCSSNETNSTGLFCIIEALLETNDEGVRDSFLEDYMFIIGLLMVLQYHVWIFLPPWATSSKLCAYIGAPNGRRFGFPLVRLVGRHICIFNMYYDRKGMFFSGPPVKDNPLTCSILFVLVDAWVLGVGVQQLAASKFADKEIGKTKLDKAKNANLIQTRYADFSVSARFASTVFFAQLSLFLLFVLSLNADPDTHNQEKVIFFHWIVGVAVTVVAGADEIGASFDYRVWDMIWNEFMKKEYSEDKIDHKILRFQWYLRFGFDFIINSFAREALLGLAPVVLSVSGRMDFIKDCLAIFFIAKMDDIDDAKSAEHCFKEMKARSDLQADKAQSDVQAGEAAETDSPVRRQPGDDEPLIQQGP